MKFVDKGAIDIWAFKYIFHIVLEKPLKIVLHVICFSLDVLKCDTFLLVRVYMSKHRVCPEMYH